jgi:putative permease
MLTLFRDWINKYFSDPQVIILGFLLVLGFLFVFFLGDMLIPVFAGFVIAYLLEGVVNRLQRFKVPRNIAVIIVFILFLAMMLVVIVGLLPMLSRQIGQLLQDLPAMISKGQTKLMLLPEKYPDIISKTQINEIISFVTAGITKLGQSILSYSVASVRSLISVIVYLILVPLLVFFFLKDKQIIIKWVKGFLPDNRRLANQVWKEVNLQVANYVRGKIWEIIIVWFVSYITFKLFGLRFAMLISMFVGLSVLIPYIGATVMFLPVILIAFLQWGVCPKFTYTVIAYGIIQLLDGNLLAPLLLSEVVNLHPVAIIVAVLVFGGFGGIWGLFFAIPLATLVHAVIKAWVNSIKANEVLSQTE